MGDSKRNKQKGKKGVKRLRNALLYSRDGFLAAWREECGFRQVIFVAGIGLCCGLWLGNGFDQKILLVLPGVLCVIVELLNSAIENAIDHTSIEQHPFAKKAKDMGSAAQLASLVFFVFVWGIFLFHYLF